MYTSLPTNLTPGSVVDTYLRDSGGPRQDKSTSQQLNEIKEYCARNNLVLRTTYMDVRRSGGTTAARDEFMRMMEHYKHITNRPVALLLWNYARFARDIDDAQFHKIILRKQWGIIVHSISDQIPDGKYGKLAEYFIDLANEEKREQASYEAARGLRDLVQIHGCVPGVPPTGFLRVPVDLGDRKDKSKHIAHRWEINPEYAPRIKRAFEMRAARIPIKKIQDETKLMTTVNSWKGLFTNKIYIGILEYADLVIENYCEPIIDKETWDAVQSIVNEYAHRRHLKNPRSHPTNTPEIYPLTGIAICDRCGSPMSGYTSGRNKITGTHYYRYACTRARRGAGCDLPAVPAVPIHKKIIETLSDYLQQPETIDAVLAASREGEQNAVTSTQDVIKEKKSDLVKVRRYIANITTAIREHGHSKSLLMELNKYENEEHELETAIHSIYIQPTPRLIPEEVEIIAMEMQRLINSNNPTDVADLLRYLISEVRIDRDKNSVHFAVSYRLVDDDLKKNTNILDPKFDIMQALSKCASISPLRGGTYL